jgi:hypothetical protein
MDQVFIPVGHLSLFLPSPNFNLGDYYLESLFGIYHPGKILLVSGLFLLLHNILILLIRCYGQHKHLLQVKGDASNHLSFIHCIQHFIYQSVGCLVC